MPASRWSPSRPRSPTGLRLKIGDTVTVNVLGRNVTARIANLREVKWESLSLNFVLVFSPNTLGRRAAQSAGDRHAAEGRPARRRGQTGRSRSAAPFRRPPPSASRTPSMPLTSFSRASWWPCVRPAASPCSPAPWSWPARSGDRPAPPHPAGRDPEDAWAPRAAASCCRTWPSMSFLAVVNVVHFPPDRQLAAWMAVTRVMESIYLFLGAAAGSHAGRRSVLVAAVRRLWHVARAPGADQCPICGLSRVNRAGLAFARATEMHPCSRSRFVARGPCKQGIASP